MRKASLFVASILLCSSLTFAQDARIETIKKIVAAQGIKEMFDDSLMQSRESAAKLGADLYKKSVAAGQVTENARHKESYERYMRAAAALFTSDEIIAQWSALYGKNLTLAELNSILAYYQSPAGRKDVAATKIAMQQFMGWFGTQGQSRLQALMETLARDLADADKQCESKPKSTASGTTTECT